ncbi:hypothetical protein P691DRAFT_738603 [Macrolepiota fuliginosa MF-IS2]|uniref:Uncharacterized protein n=1 Tax=Macrolepiota fuliginosa MF-IS2 TaxID=1400762 RepID=A0A9P5X4Q3_9AGAR|nr:hypothetical protein P691DRAFT_738603 [Macrolepiota fuliginosa MF-IS2]
MRLLSIFAAALPALVRASPTPRWTDHDDIAILNFELAVEQLENAFYCQGLEKFSQEDFARARLPRYTRGRFEQIRHHEHFHEEFLETAIRAAKEATVQPCNYTFPLHTPRSFVRNAVDVETISESAYIGAMDRLQRNDFRVADAAILGVEARQASWIHSAIEHLNPWNTALDVPLTPRQVWTILQRYIESCPSDNAKLLPPRTTDTFEQLKVVGRLHPGQRGQVRFHEIHYEEECLFVIFKTGVSELSARLGKHGYFVVPEGVKNTGADYIFVTRKDSAVTDDNIVAGPTLYMFSYGSNVY